VEAPEMQNHKKKACEDISKDLKIPGFRPGHAPQHIVEQYIDKKHLLAHAYEIAVQYSYAEAVTKEKLQVISHPKIKFISDTTEYITEGTKTDSKDSTDEAKADSKASADKKTFKFEAEVAVLPEIKIKDHKSIKVPKEDVKIEAKEIDETVGEMRKYFTKWHDVDREVKKGDRVEIDFEGFDPKEKDDKGENKPIPNTVSKNHPVIVGENTLVPGFEDELVGMKKTDKKEFTLTFPKEYHKKDFQNKKVLFKVEMKRIEEGEVPELNEELVEKVTGKKMTVEEFKKDIEQNIKAQKEEKAKQLREDKYLSELLKHTEMEVPDALIEQETDFIIEDMQHDMAHRGIQFDKFLEQTKLTVEDLRKKYRDEAEKRIKVRMAITHLITEEKITVEDKEVEDEIKKILGFYPPEEQAKIKAEFESKDEKIRLKNKLLLNKFFDAVLK